MQLQQIGRASTSKTTSNFEDRTSHRKRVIGLEGEHGSQQSSQDNIHSDFTSHHIALSFSLVIFQAITFQKTVSAWYSYTSCGCAE